MAETHGESGTSELDRAVDLALSRLATPEASADLPERVLDRVSRPQLSRGRGRFPALAAAAAVLLAVAVLLLWRTEPLPPKRLARAPVPTPEAPHPTPAVESQPLSSTTSRPARQASAVRIRPALDLSEWTWGEEGEGPEPLPALPLPEPLVVAELLIPPLELGLLEVPLLADAQTEGGDQR